MSCLRLGEQGVEYNIRCESVVHLYLRWIAPPLRTQPDPSSSISLLAPSSRLESRHEPFHPSSPLARVTCYPM